MKKLTLISYLLAVYLLTGNLKLSFAQTNCDKPSPPNTDDVRPLTIDWVWENRLKDPVSGFYNLMLDQIFDNGGYLNYIVRWESNETVTAAKRDEIEVMLNRQVNKWIDDWLTGYDCWPFGRVHVNVVAWAVADRSVLLWNDNEWDGIVYTGYTEEGAPHGPQDCNRFYHQDGNYPNCTTDHFDMALWCTQGFSGGAGGDWGQRVSSTYILQNTSAENVHILLHEMGHSNGLPDFYVAEDFPPASTGGLPPCVMQAGAASYVTPWDGWMLRRVYSELKANGDRGWTFDGGTCDPTSITPYAQINDGSWEQIGSVSVQTGDKVKFGPQPTSGGSWNWSGPSGFTASTREITIDNIQTNQAGVYVATYTNDCGTQSTQNFNVTVSGSGGTTNIALTASVSTSFVSSWETLGAVNDGYGPSSSSDNSNGAYGNWDGEANYNTWNWVQYDWTEEQQVNSTEVYWWDDNLGIDQPTDAYIEYYNGSSWINAGSIGLTLNQWNSVSLNVPAKALRINMISAAATGILEWRVWGMSSTLKDAPEQIVHPETSGNTMVYPNPASFGDIVAIDFEASTDESTLLTVYNIQGQTVLEKSVCGTTIHLNTSKLLKQGIYYVHIKNSVNNETKKLLVK